jgi:hypothetical protein
MIYISNKIKKFSIMAFFFIISGFSTSFAQRAIPANILAYPVHINIPNKFDATGFYLRNDTHLYLVTTKHLLLTDNNKLRGNSAICVSYPEDYNETAAITVVFELNTCNKQRLIMYHETHDAAIIQVGTFIKTNNSSESIKFNKGISRTIMNKNDPNIVMVNINNTKLFNDVLISNDVFINGYPMSIGLKNDPQFEYYRPLLRKGIVAGKNIKKETIIIDCPAYGGNSGSPVIEEDQESFMQKRFYLIGILSEYIPYSQTSGNKTPRQINSELSNSGYSVVTPIDKVLELISKFDDDK